MTKIGIIGSGAVGKTLAKGFLDRGYPTTIASRSAETRQQLAEELGDKIQTAAPEDTAHESELIVFAVKGTAAKKQVSEILDQFGWDTADMGSAVAARAIEPLARLWCIPGFRENSWGHAFKLMR